MKSYSFETFKHVPVIGVAYIDWETLLTQVRKIQPASSELIPDLMENFKDDDFKKVEDFVCSNTELEYRLNTLNDQFVLGMKDMYEETISF